jgi:hypothetical protein
MVSMFSVELEGRYIKPPKLCGQGKLALSTLIEFVGPEKRPRFGKVQYERPYMQ